MLVQSNIETIGHRDRDPESHSVLCILGVGGLVTELRVIHQTKTLPLSYIPQAFHFLVLRQNLTHLP